MKEYLYLFEDIKKSLPTKNLGDVVLISTGSDVIPAYFDSENKVFVNLGMTRNLPATHWLDLSKLTRKEAVINFCNQESNYCKNDAQECFLDRDDPEQGQKYQCKSEAFIEVVKFMEGI